MASEKDEPIRQDEYLPGELRKARAAPPTPAEEVFANKLRGWGGGLSYLVGVAVFLWVLCWAMGSLDKGLTASYEAAKAQAKSGMCTTAGVLTETTALMYLAKAIIVVTAGSFTVVMLRLADRMTMPIVRYLQMVDYQSRNTKRSESTPLESFGKTAEMTKKLTGD